MIPLSIPDPGLRSTIEKELGAECHDYRSRHADPQNFILMILKITGLEFATNLITLEIRDTVWIWLQSRFGKPNKVANGPIFGYIPPHKLGRSECSDRFGLEDTTT